MPPLRCCCRTPGITRRPPRSPTPGSRRSGPRVWAWRRSGGAGPAGVLGRGAAGGGDTAAPAAAGAARVKVLFLPGRHTVAGLADLGVRRISLGSLLFRAALHATVETARAIRAGEP